MFRSKPKRRNELFVRESWIPLWAAVLVVLTTLGCQSDGSPKEESPGALERVGQDFANFYSLNNLALVGAGLVPHAVMANTRFDENLQDGYRERWRSKASDDFADLVEIPGEHFLTLPLYGALAAVGAFTDSIGGVSTWGARSLRAIMVGTPTLLFLQRAIGATRPSDEDADSSWRFFDDNNAVSGHAFVGAVPFLVAADMVESPWVSAPLYLASALPAWARLNNDDHFLSQVSMGWWLAFLASRSVRETDDAYLPTVRPLEGGGELSWAIPF